MSPPGSTLALAPMGEADEALLADVLVHLHGQIASVQKLLEIVLEQGTAIRSRDVHAVVRLAGILHGELARRGQIERDRSLLLERAGARLGIAAEQVTVSRLATLMDPASARLLSERSAQLRGLLEELRREYACNRAIMQVELAFLDHLMTSLALDGRVHGYDPRGAMSGNGRAQAHGALHVLDLEA